jgi:hypothetical protein
VQEDEDALALVQSCRAPYAYTSGGVAAQNPDDAKACRSVLSLMVRQMGRTLLQGGNVMSVSLPIQCCQPRTILEVAGAQPGYAQHFLPRAAAATDPVERLKYVIATFVSGMALTSNNFLKPLNPILGETLQSEFSDGSCLFMEQVPPRPGALAGYSRRAAQARTPSFGWWWWWGGAMLLAPRSFPGTRGALGPRSQRPPPPRARSVAP